MRGIRQDFTHQNYGGPEAIFCNEVNARFHIYSYYNLGGSDIAMELEQFSQCMTSIGQFYFDYRKSGGVNPNEPEFRALQILLHAERPSLAVADLIQQLSETPRLANSEPVIQAQSLYETVQSLKNGNHPMSYVSTFFSLVKSPKTSYLLGCLAARYIPDVRRSALRMIAENYMKTSEKTSLQFIKDFLCYESIDEVREDVYYYGLEISGGNDGFAFVIAGKRMFSECSDQVSF
jgi:hypothetical protein